MSVFTVSMKPCTDKLNGAKHWKEKDYQNFLIVRLGGLPILAFLNGP